MIVTAFYFNLIFGNKIVILIYFFFLHGEIKLTYLLTLSVQPREWIFVKGYGFLSFAKNMAENIRINISKNLRGTCSQKLLHQTKQYATDPFKTASKRAIQKTVETTVI